MSTAMTWLGAAMMATGFALLSIATARVVRSAGGRMWPYALAGALILGLGAVAYSTTGVAVVRPQ